MTGPSDLEALANRYLDLWQDQIGAVASDPALAEAMRRMFGLLGGAAGAAGAAAGMPGERSGDDGTGATAGAGGATSGSQDRAAAAAAASRSGDAELAALTRRVAGLEERLARLESLAGAGGGGPAAGDPDGSG